MRRKNLDVVTDAEVLGLELDGRKATGVRLRRHGAESVVLAGRAAELILGGR